MLNPQELGFFSSGSSKHQTSRRIFFELKLSENLSTTMIVKNVVFENVELVWIEMQDENLACSFKTRIGLQHDLKRTLHICQNRDNTLVHIFLMDPKVVIHYPGIIKELKKPNAAKEQISEQTIKDVFTPKSPSALEKFKRIIADLKGTKVSSRKLQISYICN